MRIFRDSTKTKVVVGFATAFSIVVFAIYLTYSSFTQLLNSLEVLSQPNHKLVTLRQTLATMATAESSIRAYTLTSREKHFKNYLSHLDTIRAQIDTLQVIMTANPTELAQVDSIRILLGRKEESLMQYAELKKQYKTHDLSKEALRQIASASASKPLATTIRRHTTTTISDRLISDSNIIEEQEQEDQEPKKSFLGKLFSKRKDKKIEPKQQLPRVPVPKVDVRQEVFVDTSNARRRGKVADLAKVRSILYNVQREADRQEQELLNKELTLLKQDKKIMDQMRDMVYNLERSELSQARLRSTHARNQAKETSLVLLVVGIAGLLSGIAFILFILRDITRSNRYKTQLIRAQKEAVQLARAKEAFVANMSHEMRTPLNVILGFAQQLKHTSLQQEQTEHLQAIDSAGHHLLHIVNDVLDISKIEAGKLDINPVNFCLRQLATEIEQAFYIKAESRNILFRIAVDDALPDLLTGDVLRIKQVLFNLVDNAIKFTHEGQVQVQFKQKSVRRTRVVLSIEVTDTDIGIPEERLQHVFGEFNQADDSILRKYGGTGLGLSISKKLVEMQGGTLAVHSTTGEGTTFSIVLPLLTAKALPASAAAHNIPLPQPEAFAGFSALVIDDDAYSRMLSNLMLSRWGMKVYLANDGHEALALVKRFAFDIILTDIQLPGMSGKSLSRIIRKHDAEVPIMALTANILSNEASFFQNTPITNHLLKPFTEQELYQKLTEILNPDTDTTLLMPQEETAEQECDVPQQLYDLSEIRLFTGPDTETLVAVLDVMVSDQYSSLQKLALAKEAGNWKAAADTAHKMLTAFKHLKVHSVIPDLMQLEQELHHPGQDVAQLAILEERVQQQATLVLQTLSAELKSLKVKIEEVV